MENIAIWAGLQLKLQMQRIITWIEVIVMIVLMLLVSQIKLPDSNNVQVLLYNKCDVFGEQLIESLKQDKGIFTFQEVGSEEEMRRQIMSGRAECGFVFPKGIDIEILQERPQDVVLCISSGMSSKTEVVCEVVYAKMLALSGNGFLKQQSEKIFPEEHVEEALALALERNTYYQSGRDVFQVEYETIEVDRIPEESANRTYPIRGIAAVVILLHMLILRGEELLRQKTAYIDILPVKSRKYYLFCKYFVNSIFPVIVSMIVIQMLSVTENIVFEILKMTVFMCISAIWVMLIGKLLKKGPTYFGWICPLISLNLLLPPVLVDLASYIPGIQYINWLLPVGIYLKMF